MKRKALLATSTVEGTGSESARKDEPILAQNIRSTRPKSSLATSSTVGGTGSEVAGNEGPISRQNIRSTRPKSSLTTSTAGGTGSEVAGKDQPISVPNFRTTRHKSSLATSTVGTGSKVAGKDEPISAQNLQSFSSTGRIIEAAALQAPAPVKMPSHKSPRNIAAPREQMFPVEGGDTDDDSGSETPKGASSPHKSGYSERDNINLLERLAKVQETAKDAAGSQGRFISTSELLSQLVKQYPEYRSTGKDPTAAVRARVFNSNYSLRGKFAKEHKLRNHPHSGDGTYEVDFDQSDDLYQAGLVLWGNQKHITCSADDILSLGGGGILKKTPSKSPGKMNTPNTAFTPVGDGGKIGNKGRESGSKKSEVI